MNRSQRVTEVDLRGGRIRIPIGEKAPFPSSKARLVIRSRGERIDDVAWDPRYGPDRERSGVLQVGKRLVRLVAAEDVLTVSVADGVIELD